MQLSPWLPFHLLPLWQVANYRLFLLLFVACCLLSGTFCYFGCILLIKKQYKDAQKTKTNKKDRFAQKIKKHIWVKWFDIQGKSLLHILCASAAAKKHLWHNQFFNFQLLNAKFLFFFLCLSRSICSDFFFFILSSRSSFSHLHNGKSIFTLSFPQTLNLLYLFVILMNLIIRFFYFKCVLSLGKCW